MKARISALVPLLLVLLVPTHASADAVIVCNVGGPGNVEQARSGMEKFLRHMEKSAGLEANSLQGEYHTDWAGCKAYIDTQKPSIGVFDLATHLQRASALSLSPFAHVGSPTGERYHLLVRKGAFADLASLKGKSLISPYVKDARFLNNILLGGKASSGHFVTKYTRRPLKGIRNVAREKQEATLVDAQAYAHLGELELPVALESIYVSEGLPGLTMSRVGSAGGGLADKVKATLPSLCKGDGQSLCKTFGVKRFTEADPAVFKALSGRY